MMKRMRFPILVIAGVLLAVLVLFAGCKKEPPTAGPEPASVDKAQTTAVAAEQTTCPVMGGAINKEIFVEYQGKKVYFCCKGCPETFLANPQKYVAKLPQFQN